MPWATEAFFPHTEIPPKAILELINACTFPDVPASHPRANDPSFTGENLRPIIERVDEYLIIQPADERLSRKIDMLRTVQEIINDLSKFNKEPPFPSYPDPFSLTELAKEADSLFPGHDDLPGQDDSEDSFDHYDWWVERDVERAAPRWPDMFSYKPNDSTVTAPGAQQLAAPAPINQDTPLPDYASPFSSADDHEHHNGGSVAATHTPAASDTTPRPAQEAPLPDHDAHATQVAADDQPAPSTEAPALDTAAPRAATPEDHRTFQASSDVGPPAASTPAQEAPLPEHGTQASRAPATDGPRVAMPDSIYTFQGSASSADPFMVPATPVPAQEVRVPDHNAQAFKAPANDSPAPAVDPSTSTIATSTVAPPEDNRTSRVAFRSAGPTTDPAMLAPTHEAPLPDHSAQPIQMGPIDQPAPVRKRRGRPPKNPMVPVIPGSVFENTFSTGSGPSHSPAGGSSSAPARALGNGSSASMFRPSMMEPKQYNFHEVQEKALRKVAKKPVRK